MSKKNQSERLTNQHKKSSGVVGIFQKSSKTHDSLVNFVQGSIFSFLKEKYPHLIFRHRKSISKKEINEKLNEIDNQLGNTLFVDNASIKPDGGIIEVLDNNNTWRVILVSEAKYQGKDIENILANKQVGKYNDQDFMLAGNAVERTYKNIKELANYMLSEEYFPYVLFLNGSNFLTQDVFVKSPDNRTIKLDHSKGSINRLDRLTASNYGMQINTNLCKNKIIETRRNKVSLQSTSIYTHGDGNSWTCDEMFDIMLEIAETSIECLKDELSIYQLIK